MPGARSLTILFVDKAAVLAPVQAMPGVVVLQQSLGYIALEVAVSDDLDVDTDDPTSLAIRVQEWIHREPTSPIAKVERTTNWYPLLGLLDDARSARTIGWDGAIIRGTSQELTLARACITRSMVHWNAVRDISRDTRTAFDAGRLDRASTLRGDLSRALLVMDPRVDVNWEYEYDCLDEIAAAWRTADTVDTATAQLHALDFISSERATRRQQLVLLAVALFGAVSAVPVVLDFQASPSGLDPKQPARVLIAVTLLALVGLLFFGLIRTRRDR